VDAVKALVFKKLLECYNKQDILSVYTLIQTDLRKYLETADTKSPLTAFGKQLINTIDDEDIDNLIVLMETLQNYELE
jgi:hypothetical protein